MVWILKRFKIQHSFSSQPSCITKHLNVKTILLASLKFCSIILVGGIWNLNGCNQRKFESVMVLRHLGWYLDVLGIAILKFYKHIYLLYIISIINMYILRLHTIIAAWECLNSSEFTCSVLFWFFFFLPLITISPAQFPLNPLPRTIPVAKYWGIFQTQSHFLC